MITSFEVDGETPRQIVIRQNLTSELLVCAEEHTQRVTNRLKRAIAGKSTGLAHCKVSGKPGLEELIESLRAELLMFETLQPIPQAMNAVRRQDIPALKPYYADMTGDAVGDFWEKRFTQRVVSQVWGWARNEKIPVEFNSIGKMRDLMLTQFCWAAHATWTYVMSKRLEDQSRQDKITLLPTIRLFPMASARDIEDVYARYRLVSNTKDFADFGGIEMVMVSYAFASFHVYAGQFTYASIIDGGAPRAEDSAQKES